MATRVGRRIVTDEKVRFGKPVFEGTRMDVETVVRSLAGGWTVEQVMEQYHLEREDVLTALDYAADQVAKVKARPKRSAG